MLPRASSIWRTERSGHHPKVVWAGALPGVSPLSWCYAVTVATKEMLDILSDEGFWLEQRRRVLREIIPIFTDFFVAGAQLASEQPRVRQKAQQIPFDAEAMIEAAAHFVADYANAWWDGLERRQRDALRKAIGKAIDESLGPRDVAAMIAPQFGERRARGVAITEMTNVMGAGAQAQYMAGGYQFWEWRTVRDSRVDPICESRHGQQFPISVPFESAHPGCRCWPVPAGDVFL